MTQPGCKYLFVDDRWIKHAHAVHRQAGVFEKHPLNPLIEATEPWEGEGVFCYGSCLVEGGLYRLWYQIYLFDPRKENDPRWHSAVGYAESDDGLTWRKPRVGIEHPRYGKTNVVALSSGRTALCSPAVVRDDADPDPLRRYKMVLFDSMAEEDLARLGSPFPTNPTVPGWRGVAGEGLFALVSPDGIRWQRQARPFVGSPCDASSLARLADGRFLAVFKTSQRPERHFRILAAAESQDFAQWSAERVILTPDWRDPEGAEFYGMAPFDYFGNRLGFLWIYHNAPDDKRMDVQLAAWSAQDGWQRALDRQTILPNGGRGAWDAGCIATASAPLIAPPGAPGRIWLYYGGSNVRHDDMRYRRDAIGLATLRLDGFAAMAAGHFPGELVTVPLEGIPPSLPLRLNVRAPHGRVQVTIRDVATGDPIAVSSEISGVDATDLVLPWENARPFPPDGKIALEFRLYRAALYAFWF